MVKRGGHSWRRVDGQREEGILRGERMKEGAIRMAVDVPLDNHSSQIF